MIRSRLSILCAQLVTQQLEVLHLLESHRPILTRGCRSRACAVGKRGTRWIDEYVIYFNEKIK